MKVDRVEALADGRPCLVLSDGSSVPFPGRLWGLVNELLGDELATSLVAYRMTGDEEKGILPGDVWKMEAVHRGSYLAIEFVPVPLADLDGSPGKDLLDEVPPPSEDGYRAALAKVTQEKERRRAELGKVQLPPGVAFIDDDGLRWTRKAVEDALRILRRKHLLTCSLLLDEDGTKSIQGVS